jgi:hypothetical protein
MQHCCVVTVEYYKSTGVPYSVRHFRGYIQYVALWYVMEEAK